MVTQAVATTLDKPPETPQPLYLEDQVVLEAAGLRLTIFYQEIPSKLIDSKPEKLSRELERNQMLRNIWQAVQNLKQYGRVKV